MRNTLMLMTLAAACATSGSGTQSSSNARRASTEAVDALIKGDYAGALARADRGLAAHPDDPWLLYNKGAAQASLGKNEEALATLMEAEKRFTGAHERSLATYRRGLILEFAGRCEEASAEFYRYAALVRDEQPELAKDALAHLQYCITPTAEQVAERQESEALKLAASDEQHLKVDAASTAAVNALVAGNYDAALAQARAGLEIVPDDPWLLYNEGTALAGLGRTDDALVVLRRAEDAFASGNVHGRSVAVYRRAMALEVAGRCEEEKAELDRYAQLAKPAQPDFIQHAMSHVKFCRIANASNRIY